jgi:chaperonin cofactor prefoldin
MRYLMSTTLGAAVTALVLLFQPSRSPPTDAAPPPTDAAAPAATQVASSTQNSRTLEERVEALERHLSTGGDDERSASTRLDRLEQRVAVAEAASRRAGTPSEVDAGRVRSAVETLEDMLRRIDNRVATIERGQRTYGPRAPEDDLFELRRTVDRLAVKVNDLDYRVRRLEFGRGR